MRLTNEQVLFLAKVLFHYEQEFELSDSVRRRVQELRGLFNTTLLEHSYDCLEDDEEFGTDQVHDHEREGWWSTKKVPARVNVGELTIDNSLRPVDLTAIPYIEAKVVSAAAGDPDTECVVGFEYEDEVLDLVVVDIEDDQKVVARVCSVETVERNDDQITVTDVLRESTLDGTSAKHVFKIGNANSVASHKQEWIDAFEDGVTYNLLH